jgi:hypothetical protein
MSEERQGWRAWIHSGRIEYAGYEWLLMRVAFAMVAWPTLDARHLANFKGLSDPHGMAQFVDLTWMLESGVQAGIAIVAVLHLILYVLNVVPLWACTVLLVTQSLLGTVVNSQGAIHHTSQIVSFVLIGHVVGYGILLCKKRASEALDWRGFELPGRLKLSAPAEVIYSCQQLIAVAYVVSGISKLIRSQGEWISSIPNIVLQLEKTRMMAYYNSLEPPPETAVWAIAMITSYPVLAKVFFAAGLGLELFAFVALFNRKFMAVWGIALIMMHVSITQIMNLGFFYNKWLLAIFWVNVPFWCLVVANLKLKRGAVLVSA